MLRLTGFILLLAVYIFSMPVAAYAEQSPQQQFVYQVADDVLKVIKTHNDEMGARKALEPVFNQYVDINWVGQFVLGRHWRSASEEQKLAFSDSYRRFMIGSYTARLQKYSGEKYEVSAPRDLGNGKSALTMKVFRPNGAPILIDYKIRQGEAGFKIYDLVVEGISLISTQRSEFDSVVNRKGLNFLIQALNRKAAAAAS